MPNVTTVYFTRCDQLVFRLPAIWRYCT